MGRPRKQLESKKTSEFPSQTSLDWARRNTVAEYRKLTQSGVQDKVQFWKDAMERAKTNTLVTDQDSPEFAGSIAWCRQWLELAQMVLAEKVGTTKRRRK